MATKGSPVKWVWVTESSLRGSMLASLYFGTLAGLGIGVGIGLMLQKLAGVVP